MQLRYGIDTAIFNFGVPGKGDISKRNCRIFFRVF